MKAKQAGTKNRKKKSAHKKQFLGTDVRTVSQLVELKCSTRRKLKIAQQLQVYAGVVLESELEMEFQGDGNKTRIELSRMALNDWNKAVKELKAEIRAANIERSKVHTPFANLLK